MCDCAGVSILSCIPKAVISNSRAYLVQTEQDSIVELVLDLHDRLPDAFRHPGFDLARQARSIMGEQTGGLRVIILLHLDRTTQRSPVPGQAITGDKDVFDRLFRRRLLVKPCGSGPQFRQREDRIDGGRRRLCDPAQFLNRPQKRVDFHRAAGVKVLQH